MFKSLSVAAIALIAGCSGGITPSAPPALNNVSNLDPLNMSRRAATIVKDLYVSDFQTGFVEILSNQNYEPIDTIMAGLGNPDGDYLDAKGNLYVANYGGKTITEYPPGQKTPSFTYSANMWAPVNVTVDAKGNVYEADFKRAQINEYAQNTNVQKYSCSPGGNVEGAAIDKRGDVFVDYNVRGGTSKVVEYKHTLSGCHETTLEPDFHFVGGIAIDRNDNLIVCDQGSKSVDILDPPYTTITSTLGSGYREPFHVTLRRDNKLAFISDPELPALFVLEYPSGKLVVRLGAANGVGSPGGAVDAPNAVY